MYKNNFFNNIPTNLKNEIFETIIFKKNLIIKRIISKGHTTPELQWYDQNDNEWVIVLKGEAILSFENSLDITLKEGDYINIPAHTKHKVSWTKEDEETIWLAIHY